MTAPRYALYYVPPDDSDLYRLGTALLGRCLVTGRSRPRPAAPGLAADELARLTETPAHYGLHATIVAPFETAVDEPALLAAVGRLAAAERPFSLPPLTVRALDGDFLALTLTRSRPELRALEARWVRETAALRRPLEPADIARRGELPARQAANLRRWGYHLVMEDFTFHITLTGPVAPADQARVRSALAEYLGPALGRAALLGALTLVRQESRTAPFIQLRRYTLG